MGDHNVQSLSTKEARATLIRCLLNDIAALDRMLDEDIIEKDITRIGAEQEFCLVTDNWRPSRQSLEILEAIDDPHFTTELARYNLEINLDPIELTGKCFSSYEETLRRLLAKATEVAEKFGNRVVLTGILPTISKNEVELDYMTPISRYYALNDMMKELRGKDFELYIRGVEELSIRHDSVLFEACNTSFQIHLQISPDDFISSYNWSQAIAGPVLGISCNSPLLLGRELWSETRIALFQQSIDTRSSSYALQEQQARVTFGNSWAYGSIAEIFKNDIAKYKIILAKEIEQDAMQELDEGRIPKLQALALHNSTVYRWNRPCYGVGNGTAHLRIENRYIPSGPTSMDEVANFAFWVGLMKGRPAEFDDLPSIMDFRDVRSNFIKAARTGKESVMRWMGKQLSVRDLIIEEFLPIARAGLEKMNIEPEDIDRYLGIIEARAIGMTGAQWCIKNYRELKANHNRDDALLLITKSIYKHQRLGLPVSEWPGVDPDLEAHEASHLVGHIMSTELFTVTENDLADLATSVMQWKAIHHLPVENKNGLLCGILTWTHMKRFQERGGNTKDILVSDIMTKEVITVRPDTEIKNAIALMKRNEIGCVPVVQDKHLIGIITIDDVRPYDND